MNRDSLFFLLFMAGAVAYIMVAQRLREWSNEQKKSLGDDVRKRSDDSTTWRPEKTKPAERGYTIPEILKRAAERTLTQVERKETSPLSTSRQPNVPREVLLPRKVVNQPHKRVLPSSARSLDSANLVRIQATLQHPKAIRDAIILSEILQAPKALR